MQSIGAFDAKTHLARLLDRVEQGEEIVITRRGDPVAMLVPVRRVSDRERMRALIDELKSRRKGKDRGHSVGGSVRELIDVGRQSRD